MSHFAYKNLRPHWMAAVVLGVLMAGCSVSPPQGVQPVSPFSVERYLGTWYEIARLDHSFERGMSHVTATYQLNHDNSLKVINRGYNADKTVWNEALGHALFTGSNQVGALKVSFFGPFYGGYNVVALDDDYQWSLVMGPDRDYFWILARTPHISEALKARLLTQAEALGIDVAKLIWVDQSQPAPQ